MNHESLRDFALGLPHATEHLPFDEYTLVFKVHGKMFASLSLDEQPARMNLKNTPERNIELREEHPWIIPGYHMNKQHWNTVTLDGSVPVAEVKKWIDASYELVFASLPKKVQVEISEGS